MGEEPILQVLHKAGKTSADKRPEYLLNPHNNYKEWISSHLQAVIKTNTLSSSEAKHIRLKVSASLASTKVPPLISPSQPLCLHICCDGRLWIFPEGVNQTLLVYGRRCLAPSGLSKLGLPVLGLFPARLYDQV